MVHRIAYCVVAVTVALLLMTACAAEPSVPPEEQANSEEGLVEEESSSSRPATTAEPLPRPANGAAIIVDHTNTDLSAVPAAWIEAARQKVVWLYGHTSHGSQLVIGASYLSDV